MTAHRTTAVYGESFALMELNTWPSSDVGAQEDSGPFDCVTLLPQAINRLGFGGGNIANAVTNLVPSPADARWILDYTLWATGLTRNGGASDTGFFLTITGGVLTPGSSTIDTPFNIAHVVLVGEPVVIRVGPSGAGFFPTTFTAATNGTIRGTCRFLRATANGSGTAPSQFRLGVYLRVFP